MKFTSFKSLDPYEYLGIFFRSYQSIIQYQIVRFVKDTFRTESLSRGVYRIYIILILKMKQSQNFNQYRPISLCNFTYNIVSKIIVQRFSKIIPKFIFLNQEAFVEGRWIRRNSVIAQDFVHIVKKHKARNVLMLPKLDMKKAYERLEWCFIDNVGLFFLEKLGI